MINLITTDYLSPRWTGEILDCAMPMTLDSYTCCSYQCLYCFAYFQRAHNVAGYSERQVRGVDPDRIRKLFTDALLNKETTKANSQFKAYIQDRKYCQWGGMSDPFDENERKYKISLQVLRFMDEIDYPLSISTKGAWFTEDPRYMNIIKKHAHNWHFKISIISTKEEMVKKIELGVPSTQERFKAMERLASLGLEVTLRYRPYIPIMSEDYTEMLKC